MGNVTKQQKSAFEDYNLLLLKKHIRETLQTMIETRENELLLSDNNEQLNQQYLGYRMALEDLYYGLYDQVLPEPVYKPVTVYESEDVF